MTSCFSNALTDEYWAFTFDSSNVNQLEMGSSTNIKFSAQTNASWENTNLKIQIINSDEDIAYTNQQYFNLPSSNNDTLGTWNFSFNLTSEFLGYTKLNFRVVELGE